MEKFKAVEEFQRKKAEKRGQVGFVFRYYNFID